MAKAKYVYRNTQRKVFEEKDYETVRELGRIQCTNSEIAAVMKCSIDTVDKYFAELIKEAREDGKSSLRRMQYKRAMEGNTALLIWLGKHILGQKEQIELTTHETDVMQLLKKWEHEGSRAITKKGWYDNKDKKESEGKE